jgi:spore coat polysaccharide biosynthesis predicted glycosyltransferase SpsG
MTASRAGNCILVRCDAGRRHGLGHLARCLTLSDAFRQAGYDVRFVSDDADAIVARRVQDAGFGFTLSPGHAGSAADLRHLIQLANSLSAAVLLDSKDIDASYCAALSQQSLLICLDDEALRDLPCHLLVNPNIWIRSGDYPARDRREILAGAAANLVHPAYFELDRRSPAPRLLVTLGGEDPKNDTLAVVRAVARVVSEISVDIVLGPAHPDPASAQAAAAALIPHARCIFGPPSLLPYIRDASVAVTAAGTTCYELAAARVPQIGMAVEDHQQPLAEAMARAGCMLYLGRSKDVAPAAIRDSVTRILSNSALGSEMETASSRLMPAAGSMAVVRRAISLADITKVH